MKSFEIKMTEEEWKRFKKDPHLFQAEEEREIIEFMKVLYGSKINVKNIGIFFSNKKIMAYVDTEPSNPLIDSSLLKKLEYATFVDPLRYDKNLGVYEITALLPSMSAKEIKEIEVRDGSLVLPGIYNNLKIDASPARYVIRKSYKNGVLDLFLI